MIWTKATTSGPSTATPSSTTRSSGKTKWWWRVLAPAEWGGLLRFNQTVTPGAASAAKAARFKPEVWLTSNWKKTGQYRSNMRWGSLSYIATTWEEHLAPTDDCGAVGERAKVDLSRYTGNEGVQHPGAAGASTNLAIARAFLLMRAPQGLAIALAAATAYAMYRMHLRKRRPRCLRQRDETHTGAVVTAGAAIKRLWHLVGGYSRGTKGEDTSGRKAGDCGGASGGGGGGETRCGEGRIDDTDPKVTQSHGEHEDGTHDGEEGNAAGRAGEEDGRVVGSDESYREGIFERVDPMPTAPLSPEHNKREEHGGGTTAGHAVNTQIGGDVPFERGSQRRDREQDYSAENEDRASTRISRGLSSLSESSTEELLAEVEHLIADATRRTSDYVRTPSASTTRSRKNRPIDRFSSSVRATGRRIKDKPRGTSTTRPSIARTSSASRPSDIRSPKRARVYREVSDEEVNALVGLTQRALEMDPAALSEIAEDAFLQRGGNELSVGDLADIAPGLWNDGGGTAATTTLWDDRVGGISNSTAL